jgi:hypothetical protein
VWIFFSIEEVVTLQVGISVRHIGVNTIYIQGERSCSSVKVIPFRFQAAAKRVECPSNGRNYEMLIGNIPERNYEISLILR